MKAVILIFVGFILGVAFAPMILDIPAYWMYQQAMYAVKIVVVISVATLIPLFLFNLGRKKTPTKEGA